MDKNIFEEEQNERYEAPIIDKSSLHNRIKNMSDLELIESCSGYRFSHRMTTRLNSMKESMSEHGKLNTLDRGILRSFAFKNFFKITENKSLHDLLGITWKEVWDIKKGKESSVLTPIRRTEMLHELQDARAEMKFVSKEEHLAQMRQIYINYSQEIPDVYKEKQPTEEQSTPSPI